MPFRSSAPLQVKPIRLGFGGVGPWIPPPMLDASFGIELDLGNDGPGPIALAVRGVTLVDARGEAVARDAGAIEVHEARTRFGGPASYAFHDSPSFGGVLAARARTRLLLGGGLDLRLDEVLRAAPVAGRVTLAADDLHLEIELAGAGVFQGVWPSA